MPSELPKIDLLLKIRKPGRPRAIPVELEPVVIELYRRGYGYRAIARILREEYRTSSHFGTVRKLLKQKGLLLTKPN